jgi:CPA1 family monovalent cation:H+ antiporter
MIGRMEWHNLLALTVCLAAFAAWLNHRFLQLAPTVALMAMALGASLVVLALDRWTGFDVRVVMQAARKVDFRSVLMDGILPFLLFAAALHVDLRQLREERVAVIVLATVGVILAALLTGVLVWWAAGALGVALTLVQALLFGALIAPTDPIAVAGILKRAKVPARLEALVAGESLLNDGVGVVLFVTLMGAAVGGEPPSAGTLALDFVVEAAGGLALGAAVGWVACHMLAAVDDYPVEIFVTLAVATGTYTLGNFLHVSGALAVVAAGLMITGMGRQFGMSARTQAHLDPFWEVVDEVLNAMLFMLVGVEVIVVVLDGTHVGLAVAAIGAVLLARWASAGGLLVAMGGSRRFVPGTLRVLTWGGVRGGISIALVLSLPEGGLRSTLLAATYAVVVFSLLVQATTLDRLIPRGEPAR